MLITAPQVIALGLFVFFASTSVDFALNNKGWVWMGNIIGKTSMVVAAYLLGRHFDMIAAYYQFPADENMLGALALISLAAYMVVGLLAEALVSRIFKKDSETYLQ